ncbi:hypothetical protein EUGRSUZ_H02889 [Eucalyptus grandis]|uniref:Uncharacterized protein n=2 Tax=Eucalyptus grandis TaxID=71139 RepID=A0ACC3JSW4_EUCGR|nr:hypothetical protein EUGRSUZ_H02889 [Eucalyptus grandis]
MVQFVSNATNISQCPRIKSLECHFLFGIPNALVLILYKLANIIRMTYLKKHEHENSSGSVHSIYITG